MAVELPIRAHLSDDGIEQLIEALSQVGRMAGMTEKELKELGDQARKGWREGKKEINDYNKSLDKLVVGGLKKAAQAAAGFFAAHKLLELGKQIFNVTAQYQRMSAVLTNALGSRSQAQQALRMLEQFAAKTPFQVDKLTESYVKLVNQGFRPTQDELRKLGDLSASVGKDFDQLTEAIIDAQTGEFERLKEFGIRAQKEGDNVIFTFKGVQTQVDFTSKSIREYILSLGDLQGVSGSMASISETLGGKWSNLQDTIGQILTGIGNRNSGLMGGFLDLISDALTPLNEMINDNVQALRREQTELNVLVGAITDVNVPTETRKKLIEDLNRKYPDFLRNMDVEKVTNEQLVTRLKDVNEQFSRKILLAAAEQELAKNSQRIIDLVNKEAEARLELERIKRGETLKTGKGGVTEEMMERISLAKAEQAINDAIAERQKLTEENIEKLKRYQEALGIFNDTNNDYFETEEKITETEKEREQVSKGLIAQLEKRIKLLQEQKKQAETPEELRRLTIEIDGLTRALERLNKIGAGATPVIARITSEGLKVKEILEKGSKQAVDRFEKEMERLTKVQDDNLDDIKEREERRREIMAASLNFISNLMMGIGDIQRSNHEAQLAALQAEKDLELKLAGDNAKAKEAINAKFEAAEKRLRTEQAQREKQQQLFHIAINTAAAVAKTLATWGMPAAIPFIAMALAEGAVQAAIVQSAKVPKFAKGKYRVQGPGTETSDSIPALISRDESIVPASRNAKFGFALKPIIENDNFTVKDLQALVNAHVPRDLRGDLFHPVAVTDRESRLEAKLDKVIQAIQRKQELHLGIDEDGFKKWVRSGTRETEYLSRRYGFDV